MQQNNQQSQIHNAIPHHLSKFLKSMLVVFVITVAIVDNVFELDDKLRIITWVGGVGVLPFYYGSMAGLGAWYAELKAEG